MNRDTESYSEKTALQGASASLKIKTALIGYGLSSQIFHIPFIRCMSQYKLVAISSSRDEQIKRDLPDVTLYSSAEQLIQETAADLVVITAPNDVHFSLAKLAIENGKHVVIEKPFVTNFQDGKSLIALSEKHNRILSVYQNRRWDGDFLTVKKLIGDKRLGKVHVFESHFDRFTPGVRQRWREMPGEGNGILYDLGSHLIDQTLQLFGMPKAITAQCRSMRDGSKNIDFFHLVLHYQDVLAILQASPYSASPNLRFNVQGDLGNYVTYGVDPQEARLKKGVLPAHEDWSQEIPENFGRLYSGTGMESVPTERAGYETYYRLLARTISEGGDPPVDAQDALQVIRIIELAMESSNRGCTVDVA